jgi:hypothetical protein
MSVSVGICVLIYFGGYGVGNFGDHAGGQVSDLRFRLCVIASACARARLHVARTIWAAFFRIIALPNADFYFY